MRIGIVGGGVAGLQLGLFLQRQGIESVIYTDRAPAQVRAQRLANVVCRNGMTRARERMLGIDYWDEKAPDLVRLSICIRRGPEPLAFSGELSPAAHVVDMRLYWATLLEEYAHRGGRVDYRTVAGPEQVDALAARHDLMVVASGRGRLAQMFPPRPAHSPFTRPQRTYIAGFFRGVSHSRAMSLDITINPGDGETLAFPVHSFEPGLTAIAVASVAGGAFDQLAAMHVTDDSRPLEAALLGSLRDLVPNLHARIDTAAFALARPLDLAHAAITPVVRRGYVRLRGGKHAVAVGDAHVLLDPLTGQGANTASHSAWVLGEALQDAARLDESFCADVEQRLCEYAVPVSDACNARLGQPAPHFLQFLQGAAQHQGLANVYSDGFNHPDRLWRTVSSAERTAALLAEFRGDGLAVV